MGFAELLQYLDSIGVADVLMPFILVFTVVWAVLTKTKILGTEKKNRSINTMISLVMALAVVIPHVMGRYPPGSDVVDIINTAIPNVAVVLIAVLMMFIIIGISGKTPDMSKSPIGGWFVILGVVVVVYIFGRATGWFGGPSWLDFLDNPETQTLLVGAIVFALVIWFITKDDRGGEQRTRDGLGENFRKLLGGDR
ncbi:MAG: hypothetical protein KKG59_04985 [Nanoarchaeota archaeon]|nr:hypothetical protein [Nanoarchaeota archaeon]